MPNILDFLRAIAENPTDEMERLVFADWLEEQGDWRAEFLRLDHELAKVDADSPEASRKKARWSELRTRLPSAWLIVLGRSAIENCQPRFRFPCRRRWEELQPTATGAVRLCTSCRKHVYYCSNIDEAREQAEAGHCVAVDTAVARHPDDLHGQELFLGDLAWSDECD